MCINTRQNKQSMQGNQSKHRTRMLGLLLAVTLALDSFPLSGMAFAAELKDGGAAAIEPLSGKITSALTPLANSGNGSFQVTYNSNVVDLISMFTIDSNAGAQTYTVEAGSTGTGVINGRYLTVTNNGTFIIGLETAANGAYPAEAKVFAELTVAPGGTPASITYPVPDSGLQTVASFYTDTVAPAGSSGSKSYSVDGNTVTVNNTGSSNVFGAVNGLDIEDVSGNTVTVNSGVMGLLKVYGGAASVNSIVGTAVVNSNSVIFNGGRANDHIFGAYSVINSGGGSAYAYYNSVTVNEGGAQYVDGAYTIASSGSVAADRNSVSISGGVSDFVYGGSATILVTGSAEANNNSVSIFGGTVTNYIYGGIAASGSGNATAINNTVNISGNPSFGASLGLYGGDTGSTGDAFTGNTLNLSTANVAVQKLGNFEFLNFYLPVPLQAGDTMIKVTTAADITNSVVGIDFDTLPPDLELNDRITLIDADAGTLTGTPTNTSVSIDGYTFALSVVGGNKLVATLTAKPISIAISGVSTTDRAYNGQPFAITGTPVIKNSADQSVINGLTLDVLYESTDGAGYSSSVAPIDAGAYKLTFSVPAGIVAYTGSAEYSLTITKAELTITADDKNAEPGDAEPVYSYTVTGLVNGETLSVNPTITCPTADMNTAGTYPIVVSGAQAGKNYTISYQNGSLKVADAMVRNYPVLKHFDDFIGEGTSSARVDADYGEFLRLVLKGQPAQILDPDDYAITAGSTVITLSEAYLRTLPNGTYWYVAEYTGGVSDDIRLLVDVQAQDNPTPPAPTTPQTGDTATSVALLTALSALAMGTFSLLASRRRCRR